MDLVAATLLHLLVFVYWLGGDLGAFYASFIVADAKASPAVRATAGGVLSNLDMAPRTALILAGPTGLLLAQLKGWLQLPEAGLYAAWAAALLWLVLAWTIHQRHLAAGSWARQVDLTLRWGMIALLIIAGGSGLAGTWNAPLFLSLKLLILAAATGLGLILRVLLGPFGPAFGRIAAGVGQDQDDQVVGRILDRARPLVLCLWTLLILAAGLGIWTPQ